MREGRRFENQISYLQRRLKNVEILSGLCSDNKENFAATSDSNAAICLEVANLIRHVEVLLPTPGNSSAMGWA